MRNSFLAACALLLAGGAAFAIEGEPITGRDVKLGKKPPGKGIIIAHSVTDANGVVSFRNLKDGTYFVRFADADRTFEVASNGSGQPIRVRKLREAPASSRGAEPAEAPTGEKFTMSFGSVAASVEVAGDTLTVTLIRPHVPARH
jgi:hypothetical protein